MGDGRPDEPRYTAFLSYSHKDSTAAGRLHRRLETYRIPKRLVGAETPRGPVPARLAPIFRDREELPAATDLSATVREALAQSGALIVLCSPHAAASLWVAEEIETFRRIHPDRPILAAVLDGDPADCFPAVLRALGQDGTWHEPLATDLRRDRDGRRLGLLKLVAGITGVGLDALVQRDAARKIRRVTAVTGVAFLAMLMMAALTWFALDARRDAELQRAEAERQRAAAEGQIEFMLTDLRDRLRGVGSIEIMSIVNRQALDYYGRQQLTALGPDSLERRARVLLAMGEDESTRGHFDQALVAFREAHKTTESLLARSPNDPQRIFAHSQSEYWVGFIDQQRGNYRGALAAYERYRAQAARMNELAPGNPRYIGELAYSESNLGIVSLIGFHRPIIARRHFERSLQSFLRADEMQPANRTWRVEAADAHAWIADSWFAERRYLEARSERLKEREIKLTLLREEPNNRAYLLASVGTDRALARIDQELRQYDRATGLLEGARAAMRTLLRADASNLVWRDHATRIETDLAQLFLLRGDGGSAATAIQAAARLMAEGDRLGAGPSALREQLRGRIAAIRSQLRQSGRERANGRN